MSSYELAILFDPDLEIDIETPANKVKGIIEANGGKVIGEDNWGKRKLAYKINGHEMAVYVFFTAEIDAQAVAKIESQLNITDEVVRFLITKPDQKAIEKAQAAKAARAAKAEKAEKYRKENEQKEEE